MQEKRKKSACILYSVFFILVLVGLFAVQWDIDGIACYVQRPGDGVKLLNRYPQIVMMILGWMWCFAAVVLCGVGGMLLHKKRKAADILSGIGWLLAVPGMAIVCIISVGYGSKLGGDALSALLFLAPLLIADLVVGIMLLATAGKERKAKAVFVTAIVATAITLACGLFLFYAGLAMGAPFSKIHAMPLLISPFMLCTVALRYCVSRFAATNAVQEHTNGIRSVLLVIATFIFLWLVTAGGALITNNTVWIYAIYGNFARAMLPAELANTLKVVNYILSVISLVFAAFLMGVGCKTAFGCKKGNDVVTVLIAPMLIGLHVLFALQVCASIPNLIAIPQANRFFSRMYSAMCPFSDCLSGIRNLLCCAFGPLVLLGISITAHCLWNKCFAKEVKEQQLAEAERFEQESATKARERLTVLTDQERQKFTKGSYFDGGLLGLIGVNLLTWLLTALSLGIAVPWLKCYRLRWYAKHTVYDGRRLRFDGTGGQLIGRWLLWILLSIVTCGIFALWVPAKLEKWRVQHLVFADSNQNAGLSSFNGGMWGFVGFALLQFFGSIFTLGLAGPWIQCARERWLMRHTVIEGYRLRFTGRGVALFGQFIKWYLLTIITLGIYRLWLGIKRTKWLTKHVTFADIDLILQSSEPQNESGIAGQDAQ